MVATPHDALFKAIFSQLQHVREVLRAVLPPDLLRCLDLDTLRLGSATFIDEQLHDGHADLLFTVDVRDAAGEVYLLYEHQSTSPALMPWKLLRYESRAWSRHLQDHPHATHLPVIIPVVLYHGATPWPAPTAMREVYDAPPALRAALEGHLPDFAFLLDDLAAHSDEELRDRAIGPCPMLALWALKHTRHEPDMPAALRSVLDLCLAVLRAPNGKQTLGQIFR